MIDKACAQWQESCEEDKGSCWIYDNAKFSTNMIVLGIGVKLVSVAFYSLALYFYKPPPAEDKTAVGEPTEHNANITDTGNDMTAAYQNGDMKVTKF